jgi:hypothetical protein
MSGAGTSSIDYEAYFVNPTQTIGIEVKVISHLNICNKHCKVLEVKRNGFRKGSWQQVFDYEGNNDNIRKLYNEISIDFKTANSFLNKKLKEEFK